MTNQLVVSGIVLWITSQTYGKLSLQSFLRSFGKPAKIYSASVGCFSSSVVIPASPFMQVLGYRTGVPLALPGIFIIEGYCAFAEAGSMWFAMEYGGEKSLNNLTVERSTKQQGPFPAATILKVALDMARGLKYLHTNEKLLHDDIKSSNIIKGDLDSIKICDVDGCVGIKPWKPKKALEEGGVITDRTIMECPERFTWLNDNASFDEDISLLHLLLDVLFGLSSWRSRG
uniref:mitogen-activated protein kinase kinase n=1 Tax=Varanus komodoensis TaxID=61221 RepID=A0A8D2LI24_VARKO